jgi:4-hydroxy-2-oxoheptanedioate aldolase
VKGQEEAFFALRERLGAGETLIGTFVQVPHMVVADFLGRMAGLDFLCLEAEHSAMGEETIQAMVAAAGGSGSSIPVLVRVEDNAWVPIARALDAGAAGVIAPRINSAAEARALVGAARYPPAGDRGIGPGRATGYGPNSGPDYRATANQRVVVGAQVETRRALDDLDGILAVPGIDLIFVGPMDLASSLGLAPGSPELNAVIEDVVSRARAAGRAAGIFAVTAEQAGYWVARGVRLILFGSDLIFMGGGLAAALKAYRELGATNAAGGKGVT